MRTIFILALTVSLAAPELLAQTSRASLIKVGGFVHFKNKGFTIQFEYEKMFRRYAFLTAGPRIDYSNFEDFTDKNLFVGYQVKFYPLYWSFHKKPYEGIFVGLEPLWLVGAQNSYSRTGPGIGSLLGFQHVIKDKIPVALEVGMTYVQNLNSSAQQGNPEDRYFYFFVGLKAGINLSTLKRDNAK